MVDLAEPTKGPEDEVCVRPATGADRQAIQRLTSRAFSAAQVDEPNLDAQVDRPEGAGDAEEPPPLEVVAERRGVVVAAASARLRGQWFGGRRILCAAIGGVAVDREARGLGVGRALMDALLTAAYEAGAATSALIPSAHRFYASLGFGIGGRRPVFALSTAELRDLPARRPDNLRLRRATRADAAGVAALVLRRAARSNGLLDHHSLTESTAEDPTGSDSYVAEIDHKVAGWCLLNRREPSSRQANFDLVVSDLVADEPDVELTLWRLLVGDHPSALRAEAVVLPGSVLEDQLERQLDIVEDSSWMLRLLDVDAALTARGYLPGLAADLVLSVEDLGCPWNQGTRRLTVADGTCIVQPAPGATPDAVVTASNLASMFSAHLDPVHAHHQGRLRLAGDHTAATIRALFAGSPASLARTF